MHTDFNFIKERKLYRRLNLLIYLNSDWKDEYNGALELRKEGEEKQEQGGQSGQGPILLQVQVKDQRWNGVWKRKI